MKRLVHILAISASVCFLGNPKLVAAQEAQPQQWVLDRVSAQDAVIATAPFDNGITIVARCDHQVFDLLLVGLPEAAASETYRSLILLVGDQTQEKAYAWTVASDRTAAFSRVPGVLARQLAKGGRLQIILPAPPGGRRTRYVMELAPSGEAINETLSHCGWPIVDPRDDLLIGDGLALPGDLMWKVFPIPDFPDPAMRNGVTSGSVRLNCIVASQGRLRDCRVENETPRGYGFGREALRAVNQARMGLTDIARDQGISMEESAVIFSISSRNQ